MSYEHGSFGVTSVDGKIYAVDGVDSYIYLASCGMLDPTTNKQTAILYMKEAGAVCAICGINDNLYVIVGKNILGHPSSLFQVFDTITRNSLSLPNMTTKGDKCAALSTVTRIYVSEDCRSWDSGHNSLS